MRHDQLSPLEKREIISGCTVGVCDEGPMFAFIIPVRHPSNAKDWGGLKDRLSQTARSIASQTCREWQAIVVANRGADLPQLPEGFAIEWVDFPPNPLYSRTSDVSKEEFEHAVQIDKGRRVLMGALRARRSKFIMVVDDDDLVSRRIVDHAARHAESNGWFVSDGYSWSDGSRLLYEQHKFHQYCGTSLIVRLEILGVPERFEDATDDFISTMLGSHRKLDAILANKGFPLQPLPFRGAIYRVGQSASHSNAAGVLRSLFFNKNAIFHPLELLWRIKQLRWFGRSIEREFGAQLAR